MVVMAFGSYTPVFAQFDLSNGIGICGFIGPICDAFGTPDDGTVTAIEAQNFLSNRLNLVISFVFIGIILIAVYIIIRAGVKYIQSQGDEGKIGEAQKAIKSVFIGIGLLFVGIVGIVLVLAFFNATGFLGNARDCTIDVSGQFNCLNPQ